MLGYFDWQKKDYKQIPVREQVEVLSLIGDVAEKENGEPQIHAHVVVGTSEGKALGGHLLEGACAPDARADSDGVAGAFTPATRSRIGAGTDQCLEPCPRPTWSKSRSGSSTNALGGDPIPYLPIESMA